HEAIFALAVSPQSTDVYVAGFTGDPGFPGTAGGAQSVYGGTGDGFVTRLNRSLSQLLQSTYIGGSAPDQVLALEIAPTGDVYAAGSTYSNNLPGTAGSAQPSSEPVRTVSSRT